MPLLDRAQVLLILDFLHSKQLVVGVRANVPVRISLALIYACVFVCHNERRVPDEWQARQATQAIFQVSSSKHNAKEITTRVRGPFHQSITATLTEEKEKRSSLLNLHMLQSTCFGT